MLLLALLLQAATSTPVPWAVTTKVNGASTATSASVWSQDGAARLVVRCDAANEKIVSIQFIPRGGFPAAQPRPVSMNIDDNGWLGSNWQFPGSGAFTSQDAIVTTLAAQIAHGKAIKVRVINPDNTPVDVTFTGPATDAPVKRVLSACGYELGVVPARSAVPVAAPAAKPTPADEE
ncbi:hypothetical protein [Sphingomonas sp. TREG-RG-20F-R18-01]|uniref:hypothetical protein n=1 Tax=Sphingomonas sp. TREG-RG-20F-R18-01 TaxID=2914982 RepID=UPI001F58DE04|nr:hypothetical protein [Sphingomonas sp. TREG-RG-20F-R18-01]